MYWITLKKTTGNANHAEHGNALQFLFVSVLREIIWVCIYVDGWVPGCWHCAAI